MDFSSLEAWGYLAVAFFSFGGSFVIVAAAGVFSAMGHMDLTLALIIAAVANFMGDNFLFYLARYHRKEVIPYFEKHRRKLALANLIMRRYGVWAIFIQKFLYGVKTLVPLVMGMGKYPFGKFIVYNAFASVLFVCVIGLSGYFASEPIIAAFGYVKQNPWLAPVFLAVIFGGAWYLLERASKKS